MLGRLGIRVVNGQGTLRSWPGRDGVTSGSCAVTIHAELDRRISHDSELSNVRVGRDIPLFVRAAARHERGKRAEEARYRVMNVEVGKYVRQARGLGCVRSRGGEERTSQADGRWWQTRARGRKSGCRGVFAEKRGR